MQVLTLLLAMFSLSMALFGHIIVGVFVIDDYVSNIAMLFIIVWTCTVGLYAEFMNRQDNKYLGHLFLVGIVLALLSNLAVITYDPASEKVMILSTIFWIIGGFLFGKFVEIEKHNRLLKEK